MITVGEEQLKELFVGEMGIKKACIGEEPSIPARADIYTSN